jgi:DNA-binding NtrC family response regulator
VDDEEIQTRLLKTLLHRNSFKNIKVFHNGKDLMACLIQDKPSLVISDYKMPGMDGKILSSKIKSLSNIPVIIISGNSNIECCADAFLRKPYDSKEIIKFVKRFLC